MCNHSNPITQTQLGELLRSSRPGEKVNGLLSNYRCGKGVGDKKCGHVYRVIDGYNTKPRQSKASTNREMAFVCPVCAQPDLFEVGILVPKGVGYFMIREPGECGDCKHKAKGVPAEFRQTIGALVVRFDSEVSGSFCRGCLVRNFLAKTFTTSLVGWFSVTSFLLTPVYVIGNVFQLFRTLPRSAKRDPYRYTFKFTHLTYQKLRQSRDLLAPLIADGALENSDKYARIAPAQVSALARKLGVHPAELSKYLNLLSFELLVEGLLREGEPIPERMQPWVDALYYAQTPKVDCASFIRDQPEVIAGNLRILFDDWRVVRGEAGFAGR